MRKPEGPAVKVLFIAGSGRSGTTILGNILGETLGFVSVGELAMLWEPEVLDSDVCGCSNPFRNCTHWQAVFDAAYGGYGRVDSREVGLLLRRHVRTRHFLARVLMRRMEEPPGLSELRETLRRLYVSIADVTGSTVVVDSSKRPVYGAFLAGIPGLDVYVLHLVRDPRAVVHSWSLRRIHPYLNRPRRSMNLVKGCFDWVGLNWVAERMLPGPSADGHYRRLRYEDFTSNPRQELRGVFGLLGMSQATDPFVAERQVMLRLHHTAGGNLVRFQTGWVEVKPDREWEAVMTPFRKALVTAMTWPWMPKYGYSLSSDTSTSGATPSEQGP